MGNRTISAANPDLANFKREVAYLKCKLRSLLSFPDILNDRVKLKIGKHVYFSQLYEIIQFNVIDSLYRTSNEIHPNYWMTLNNWNNL